MPQNLHDRNDAHEFHKNKNIDKYNYDFQLQNFLSILEMDNLSNSSSMMGILSHAAS